jgi:tetratricopeptide (TPR) repeat protein
MDGPGDDARVGVEVAGSLSAGTRAVVFFLALGVRLLALAELSGSPWNDVLLGDARHFDTWGRRIAAGDWLGDGVFYQAPLYPYLLGSVYALFGHAPDLVRVLQAALGALSALWIAQGACRLAAPRAGLAAGLLAALYAPALWYDLQIEKTSLAFALTALLLHLALAPLEPSALRRPLAAGFALGALVLLRENAAVLLLPLAWAIGRAPRGRARRLLAFAAGLALLLVPVGLRNRVFGGAFLPTTSNAGVNFYIGNGAEADGLYRPLVAGRGHPDHEREDARRIAEDLSGRTLTPAEVSGFWFARALREIADEPGHYVGLLARKARWLAHHGEVMDAVAFEVFRDESRVLHGLGWLSFGVLLPLALAGMALVRGRRAAGVPLLSAALLALSIVFFFVVGRFRLGLVPFLLPFAGVALAEWRDAARKPLAIALLAAGTLLAWWPLATRGDPRAVSASNLSSELLRQGDCALAERWARAARARDASQAEAAYNLGVALRRQGRAPEAREPFESAMRLEPAFAADCLAELGAIRALEGDARGARELLERALALEPEHPDARRYLEALERGLGSDGVQFR